MLPASHGLKPLTNLLGAGEWYALFIITYRCKQTTKHCSSASFIDKTTYRQFTCPVHRHYCLKHRLQQGSYNEIHILFNWTPLHK